MRPYHALGPRQMRNILITRSQWLPRSLQTRQSVASATRCYATETPSKVGRPFAYTWLTKAAQETTPDDVLSSLPSDPASSSAAPVSVPLLLVTPSFAHWLDPSSSFLSQFLTRLYGSSPGINSLHAVTAVVDTLPDTTSNNPDSNESEGLSLLAVDPSDVAAKVAPPRLIRSSASEETNLLFSIQTPHTGQGKKPAHEIGLRLANTIFVNGKDTTIFGSRWLWDNNSNEFVLDKAIDFTSCMVTATAETVGATLELPLHQVTERRRVITSMGNILRQLAKSTDATSTEPIPASTDLEKELPRYIKEHNITDHRVSVWALVEKPELVVADSSSSTHDRLVQSLKQGGKLHRVMSGGGGWGKKQGLLSLDPEVSFSGTINQNELISISQVFDPKSGEPLDTLPSIDQGIAVDDLSLLSQVATAGDYIQFFVSVEPTESNASRKTDVKDEAISYHFGMVADSMELEAYNPEDSKEITTLPQTFGALSEKAIAYSQPMNGDSKADSSTKLDVPGCRVTLNSPRLRGESPLIVYADILTLSESPMTPPLRVIHPGCFEVKLISLSQPFFGALGCTSAIVFTCFGAAYGTAKAGVGVCSMAVLRPDLIVKNIVPIVMAGIIGIYGLVVSVLVANDLTQALPLYTGFIQLGAGLSVGLAGLAAGFAIGIVGDAGVRGTAQQPRLYVGMILILIFAEVLGLYGLIVALLMNSRSKAVC
ncbi:unnamed protein product [Penicillium salamii]|uniref:V-type proton ATPase subunit C n=1 Tax=Penicillium salamii TaxID=1612424 RepID=A0A9W4IK59_9EURO|nr:unnamed protein product [Penicillium salamii]CAG8037871.1 unnamed protein product [Penicillium salamii]CAG8059830.1 unnamed protein product [Penicillium salamii]CAG8087731.1 unnamed protein product [Penicillium salamii]CAG8095834.1 unnamed protein product [Penicillium salamii]